MGMKRALFIKKLVLLPFNPRFYIELTKEFTPAIILGGLAWLSVRYILNFEGFSFWVCVGLASWVCERVGEGLKALGDSRRKLSPEFVGELVSILVPAKTRKECFEPYFEDLKGDRLKKIARSRSRFVKRWIEFCFYFRLSVTVVQSLVCYLGESLAKIAPVLRALFFRGG